LNTDFKSYLAESLPLIESYLDERIPRGRGTSKVECDLDTYLFEPLVRFIGAGGKRVRPCLALIGCEAAGAPKERGLSVGVAIELFQAAALIHDDIADESELRRNIACVHVSEGVGLAINIGDSALVAASQAILADDALDADTKLAILDGFLAMQRRTIEGQALDLGWVRDGRWDLEVEDYLNMARLKTAYYSCAVPLALGATAGGGSQELIDGLTSFGISCGLAFQIIDDLLNLADDGEEQGKDLKSDISEGKRTLIMVYALHHLDERDRNRLIEILSSHTTDGAELDEAVALARKAGALDYAHSYAIDLAEHAKQQLGCLPVAHEVREVLGSLADFFVERRS
jgi:geranylgeranyl diphosphate synthase type I